MTELFPIQGVNWNPPVYSVWAKLNLECEPVIDEEVFPAWFEYELNEVTLEEMMGVEDWPSWALESGYAPGQWILLRLYPPCYTQDYWGEWDVEYRIEVAGWIAITSSQAAEAWEAWLRFGEEVP